MNFEEFLTPEQKGEAVAESKTTETTETINGNTVATSAETAKGVAEEGDVSVGVELDVQKQVVEALAADKAEQTELISQLRKKNYALQSEISTLKDKLATQSEALEKVGDILLANNEPLASSKIALLDRDIDVPDRFPGETRDQVLEVINEARAAAEKEGRTRRAQLLESVLLINQPHGELAKRRTSLEKLFADNQNILSGPVLTELTKLGISHKKGEEYLLPSEILNSVY